MKLQKTPFACFLGVFCLMLFLPAISNTDDRVRHPFKEQQKEDAIDALAEEIPIFEDLPDRPYKLLEMIRAEDVFTKSRAAVYLKLRRKALKLKADAIVDLKCKTVAKAIAQSCYGSAVRWE